MSNHFSQVRELTESVQTRVKGFLLDATQPRQGPPGVFPVDELLARVVRRIAARHDHLRPDQVRLSIDPDVRQNGVHEALGDAVANLIENALRASPPEERITVSATSAPNSSSFTGLELSVADRGCGIAPDMMQKVFELGFTTEGERGGLGVGLAVSRDIVASLGGSLSLCARNRGGTRATILIPSLEQQR